jgi:HK97 family phage portal protein
VPFVVSAGQIAQIQTPAPQPARSMLWAEGHALAYEAIWRTQPHVRTCVSFLARNIAQLGLHTFRRISDVDRQRLNDHPLAQLLNKPNPRTGRHRSIDALVNDLGIYDNAFWLKMRATRLTDSPIGLLRVPPSMVQPLGDSWVAPDGYRIRGTRGYRDVPADQMVHFHGYHPTSLADGVSPIEAIRQLLAEELSAERYREQLWRNGARVSGYIKRPPNAAWSDPARQRFKASWQAQYAGDGPQAGGTPILEDGMEFIQAAFSPEQAQYVETRKLTREEVAAIYHIPLPMVGILDHATFSNVKEQHKQLYQDTLGPWLDAIAEDIVVQLLPDFDDTEGVYVEFNMAEKLRGSFEEQAAQLQTAVGGPWMTRNEARARVNLPQIDGGDELIVPLNVTQGGQASPTDTAPPPQARLHLIDDAKEA